MKTEFAYVDKLKGDLANTKADLLEVMAAEDRVTAQVADLKKQADETEDKLKTTTTE